MSKYPVYLAGQRLTAALLTAAQWDITVKGSATTKTNNTLANDPELSGVALGVGTWEIYMLVMVANSGSATPDVKTQWSFTGTWNNPLRAIIGPSSTNTGGSDAITPMKLRAIATNADNACGLPVSSAYNVIEERCNTVVVTVAGTLALYWAQNTTDAVNGTVVQPGSTIRVRQIA
jgi:hypothetical protein